MKIIAVTSRHILWDETIRYAENCSWRGGHYLAEQMKKDIFRGWERVFIAYNGRQIAGFCTFTEKDEISDEYSFSPFIGSVFVDEAYRGNRLSGSLIQNVISYACENGFGSVYIMSGEKGLYEKYGFSLLGYYKTIFGNTEQLFVTSTQGK